VLRTTAVDVFERRNVCYSCVRSISPPELLFSRQKVMGQRHKYSSRICEIRSGISRVRCKLLTKKSTVTIILILQNKRGYVCQWYT